MIAVGSSFRVSIVERAVTPNPYKRLEEFRTMQHSAY